MQGVCREKGIRFHGRASKVANVSGNTSRIAIENSSMSPKGPCALFFLKKKEEENDAFSVMSENGNNNDDDDGK